MKAAKAHLETALLMFEEWIWEAEGAIASVHPDPEDDYREVVEVMKKYEPRQAMIAIAQELAREDEELKHSIIEALNARYVAYILDEMDHDFAMMRLHELDQSSQADAGGVS